MATLSHHPCRILISRLRDLGFVTFPSESQDWPAFPNKEPNTPDNLLAVYLTTPTKLGRIHVDGFVSENLGFSLRVRSSTAEQGYLKINEITEGLDNLYQDTTILEAISYRFNSVQRESGPIALGSGPDIDDVFFHSLNILADIKQF